MFFADLSGDYYPLHTNSEFAKKTVFGQRVVYCLLGLTIASGPAWRTGLLEETTEALTGIDWKLRTPVYIGDIR